MKDTPGTPGKPDKADKPAAQSRTRRAFAKAATLVASLALCGALAEGAFRFLEWREQSQSFHKGAGGLNQRDNRWGWRVSLGDFEQGTAEFKIKGSINALSMNDLPVDAEAEKKLTRVLALGDSHTWPVGASMVDSWPRTLERDLDAKSGGHHYRVYNAGAPGYNLHQYLLRLIDQGPLLKPHYVVVGFSYATDLYDLLPPDRGGWVYGWPDQPRDYFDFDGSGALTERHWAPPTAASPAPARAPNMAQRARELLGNFATGRFLSRSNLALALGSKLRLSGQSLWPSMEVVVREELDEKQQYQWKLAQALLLRIKAESERQGAKMVIAGIPYLPQVYDDLWKVTFAGKPGYNQTAAIERMRAFCAERGIDYIDTREPLRARVKEVGRWLHHRRDAHPTAEGQAVIAKVIADAGLFPVVRAPE